MVSVIVTVYNKEKYIKRCLDSLIAQTYNDLRIIVVDDGSNDKSLAICRSYEKDRRVKVFSQLNCGVSSARNIGLKVSRGEYVVFVDGDDYVEPDYIEKLLRIGDGDLIISGIMVGDTKCCLKNRNYSSVESLFKNVESKYIVIACCKMFKIKIIKDNHIKFDETMNFGEDTCFVLDYLAYCKSIKTIDYVGYNNVLVDNTLSRSYVKNLNEQLMNINAKLKRIIHNKDTLNAWNLRGVKLAIVNDLANNDIGLSGTKDYVKSIDQLKCRGNMKDILLVYLIKTRSFDLIGHTIWWLKRKGKKK